MPRIRFSVDHHFPALLGHLADGRHMAVPLGPRGVCLSPC